MQKQKTKALVFTAIITVFTASAMSQASIEGITNSEQDPSENMEINSDFRTDAQVIISANSESLAAPVDNVKTLIQPEDGGEINIEAEKTEQRCPGAPENGSLPTGCLYNSIIDVGDFGSGTYTLRGGVEYRFLEETTYTDEYEILLDNEKPEVIDKTPVGGINSDQGVNVSASFEDKHSSIESTSLEVENRGETIASKNIEDDEITVSIPSSELENRNKYEVIYTATDSLGNKLNNSWSFYTETNYYGDRNPEIPGSGPIKWNLKDGKPNETNKINVNYAETEENNEKFPVQLSCYDSNGNKISNDRQNESEASKIADFSLSCKIPRNGFIDRNKEITFETCDAAGNCIENTTRSYTFDGTVPSIQEINKPADKFAGRFKINIDAEDRTTKVEKIKYRYDQEEYRTTDYKDETAVIYPPLSYPSVADTYQLDIQAVDSAGHTSTASTIETEFIGSKLGIQSGGQGTDNYDVNIEAENQYIIQADQTKNITLEISNEGTTYISETEIDLKTQAFNTSNTIAYLAPENSEKILLKLKTSQYGLYEANITGPNAETKTKLIIEPTNQQKESIVNQHNINQEKIDDIQQKITELEEKPIRPEKIDEIKSNLTELNQIHSNNSQHIDNSNYHLTNTKLDEFQEKASIIEEKNTEILKEYQAKRTRNLLLLLLVGSGSLIVLLEAFFMQSEEYDISFTDVEYIKLFKTNILMMSQKGPSISEKIQQIYSKNCPRKLKKLIDKTKYMIRQMVRDDRFKEYEYES